MFSEAVFCAEPALPIIVPPVSYHYNAVAGFAPALGLLPLGMKALHAMSSRESLIYNMTEAFCFESVRAKYQIVSERGAFERLMAQMMPRTDALKMP